MNSQLDAKVLQFVQASLSINTRRAYAQDLKHFVTWGGGIPSSPMQVAQYVAHFAQLAHTTLARRLVAIKRAHEEAGFASPTHSALVRATLQGVRRSSSAQVRQVAPLQKNLLVRMVRDLKGLHGLRDAALLLIGFAGAFRRSELVGLDVSDVRFVDEGVLLKLRRSKTDQEGVGRWVGVPMVKGPLCPVKKLQAWLEAANIKEGAVFRRMNKSDAVTDERLSAQSVGLIIKQHVQRVGADPAKFSGHSLRAGFVTNATQRGASSNSIRAQTGHKSDEMMQRYVRTDTVFADNPVMKVWR